MKLQEIFQNTIIDDNINAKFLKRIDVDEKSLILHIKERLLLNSFEYISLIL